MKEKFIYKWEEIILEGCVFDNKLIYLDRIYDNINQINTKNRLVLQIKKELDEYFDGKRKKFDIPIKMDGTSFQLKVWKALLTIPYGETRSYEDIAKQIGNDKACRAIGGANNKNPISIIVPCHRVIGKDNNLVGYGSGLDMKIKLLNLEKNNK